MAVEHVDGRVRSILSSSSNTIAQFPGGGIDSLDTASHAQASRRDTQSDLHLTQAIAAIRESFEELGILLARREDGTMANANDIAALDRKAPFAAQCAERGLVMAASEVFMSQAPRPYSTPSRWVGTKGSLCHCCTGPVGTTSVWPANTRVGAGLPGAIVLEALLSE